MSENLKPTTPVVHFTNDTITPAARTGYALLLGVAVLVFGLVGEAFAILDMVVSVLVVCGFHMLTHWQEPSGVEKTKPSRLAGTLATAQAEMPILELFLSRGSRLVELGKGLLKGIAFLAAKGIVTFSYGIILTPVNILDRSLPWLGIAFLILAMAAAWNPAFFTAMFRPLLKIRKTEKDL